MTVICSLDRIARAGVINRINNGTNSAHSEAKPLSDAHIIILDLNDNNYIKKKLYNSLRRCFDLHHECTYKGYFFQTSLTIFPHETESV